jgi:hypothetical protein
LTVDSSGVQDLAGNLGVGSASDEWLMDAANPISRVNPLANRQATLDIPVTITGNDPNSGGAPASGVASYDLYVSIDNRPFFLWGTVPALSPTTIFHAQSNHFYAFWSVAHDRAGNTESKPLAIEAATFVPDLDPPSTEISLVDSSTSTFLINVSGTDAGGSGMAGFTVSARIDAGPVQIIGVLPAGAAVNSVYYGNLAYQALADGNEHTYQFFVQGIDTAGNFEPLSVNPKAAVTATFALPAALALTDFDVQQGSAGRSFVRTLDLSFNLSTAQTTQLNQIAALDIEHPETNRIRLFRQDLIMSGSTPILSDRAEVLLDPAMLTVIDHAIEFDFGAGGIGGSATSTLGDGLYELELDLDGDGLFETSRSFHRLLGDVNGDGVVNQTDLDLIALDYNTTNANVPTDVNGDGRVNSLDGLLAKRSKGRRFPTAS